MISALYFTTATMACLFALLVVLNFINPAVSQDNQAFLQNKKPTFKEVIGDIVKNLKTVLKDSLRKNTGSQDADSGQPPPSAPPGEQAQPQPESFPPGEQAQPQPESFPPGEQAQPQPESFPPGEQAQPQPESFPPGEQAQPQPESFPPGEQAQPSPESFPPGEQAQPQPESFPPGEQAAQPSPESFPPGEQALPPLEGIPTEAQPVGIPQSFTEDLSGVPSEWMLDIQSSIAPFIYEYGQQKDPFDDPLQEQSAEGGVVVIPKTPPEEYDLKEIKLRGIIWDTQTPKALFELPNTEGFYTLIKGDKIGKNGVIFEIREGEVVVVETTYVGRGKDKKEEIKIKIKKMDRLSLFGSDSQKK